MMTDAMKDRARLLFWSERDLPHLGVLNGGGRFRHPEPASREDSI